MSDEPQTRHYYLTTDSGVVMSSYIVQPKLVIFGQRYNLRNTKQTVWNSTHNYFIGIRTKAYKANLVTLHFLTSISGKFHRSVSVRDTAKTFLEVVFVIHKEKSNKMQHRIKFYYSIII